MFSIWRSRAQAKADREKEAETHLRELFIRALKMTHSTIQMAIAAKYADRDRRDVEGFLEDYKDIAHVRLAACVIWAAYLKRNPKALTFALANFISDAIEDLEWRTAFDDVSTEIIGTFKDRPEDAEELIDSIANDEVDAMLSDLPPGKKLEVKKVYGAAAQLALRDVDLILSPTM